MSENERDCPCFVKKDRVLDENLGIAFCSYTGGEECSYRQNLHVMPGKFFCRYVEMTLEKTLNGIR